MVQLLADQLATAIETSRLYGEARDALQQLQALSDQAVATDWKDQGASSGAAFRRGLSGPGSNPALRSRNLHPPATTRKD
jgi:GAF domain-containing protein